MSSVLPLADFAGPQSKLECRKLIKINILIIMILLKDGSGIGLDADKL